jgi:hypothetical protein
MAELERLLALCYKSFAPVNLYAPCHVVASHCCYVPLH